MVKWRPWPPLISRKFEVKLTVHKLEGCDWVCDGAERDSGGLAVEIRWKGPKISLGTFRRTVKRNCTREEVVKRVEDGSNDAVLVEWDEEFCSVCGLSGYKGNVFHPWEISFAILQVSEGLSQGAKNKISVVGLGALNLAEYALKTKEQLIVVKVPLTVSNTAVENPPSLCISLDLLELQSAQHSTELVPPMYVPPSSTSGEASNMDKDEGSALKTGLRKVKLFTEFVSTRRPRKPGNEDEGSDERYFSKSEDDEYAYPSDLDSPNQFQGEFDEGKEECSARKSFSYGTLVHANYAGVSCYSGAKNDDCEVWVYYSNRRRSDAGCSLVEEPLSSAPEQLVIQNQKRSILPWRKRKHLRSHKAKGEPLLKKANGEEGGDDIDFDRRQLSSDECLSPEWHRATDEDSKTNQSSSLSEFGDDSFVVGIWEQKEVTSRDGRMKIHTQIFFASIDQRSERAAGESACTVLVAFIADWLRNNPDTMPIKSQFDTIITDGSTEWRNLCENDVFKERFPDKHFDLETVLKARIRDIFIDPESSFVGFFHPSNTGGEDFDFLHGAMTFDGIWDEISRSESVYIVSWNDHFFVLKVERDAYYIIDTLGERLHEGCSEAYILKFDSNTIIYNLQHGDESSMTQHDDPMKGGNEGEVFCGGKESCREYIKNFLAAIPIRELEADVKKCLSSAPLHRRLQIEFHDVRLQAASRVVSKLEVGEVSD